MLIPFNANHYVSTMYGIPTDYWAKFSLAVNELIEEASHLSLIDHLTDVAICFETLLEDGYGMSLARASGVDKLTLPQKHRLCFLAFLHDLGKAAVDFQRQIFTGENHARQHRGHTAVCTFFLIADPTNLSAQVFMRMLPENFTTWFQHDDDEDGATSFARMLLASWGHHGKPIDFDLTTRDRSFSDVQWNDWRYTNFDRFMNEVIEVATQFWPGILEIDEPLNVNSAFMEEFNGILQLADWIASDKRLFTYEKSDHHTDRRDFALDASKEFLKKTGRIAISKNNSFNDAFGFEPNGMQEDFMKISAELIQ